MGLRNLRSNLSLVPPDASATEVPGVGVQAFQQVNEYDGNSSALDLNGHRGPSSQQSTNTASDAHVNSLQLIPTTSPFQDLNIGNNETPSQYISNPPD